MCVCVCVCVCDFICASVWEGLRVPLGGARYGSKTANMSSIPNLDSSPLPSPCLSSGASDAP